MTASDIVVLTAAAASIFWVNWYFFLSGRTATSASAGAGGFQEITIAVRGGYEPSTIRARAGTPLRLTFDRQETSSCSEEVVFPAFGIKRFLPAFEKTTIEVKPESAGEYEFTCGMNMLRGTLVVEAADGGASS